MEDKAIYTTKEAADYLGVSPSTIYYMEKRGLLSSTKTPGGQRRFSQKLKDGKKPRDTGVESGGYIKKVS